MPRKPREKSETGIYHVMVRGIGRQDIFLEEEDFRDIWILLKRYR